MFQGTQSNFKYTGTQINIRKQSKKRVDNNSISGLGLDLKICLELRLHRAITNKGTKMFDHR